MNKPISETHPHLLKEWDYDKNEIDPTIITSGSNKKAHWICNKGHKWESVIWARTKNNTKCPYCSGKKVCIDTSFFTTHPEIAKEWHPTKNKKTTKEVTYGHTAKYWWLCPNNHSYQSRTANRVRGFGCPYCSGKKVCSKTYLANVVPESKKMWHPTKNGNLTPYDVHNGSGHTAWFMCSNKHEWRTRIFVFSRSFIQGPGIACKKCFIEENIGKNHRAYNPNLTDEDRMDRRLIPGYKEWRTKVYQRDKYHCQCCSRKNIQAHHLMSYNTHLDLRLVVSNGATLCTSCHTQFHTIYGYGYNTKTQFEEYKKRGSSTILPLEENGQSTRLLLIFKTKYRQSLGLFVFQ